MKNVILILLLTFSINTFAQTQSKIDKALNAAFEMQSIEPLQDNFKTIQSNSYWKAYNEYLQAVYLMKTGQNYQAVLESAEKRLLSKQDKNSEDYALLASIISIKMSTLKELQELMNGENNFYQYIDRAIELDKNNPRAWYVAGLYDFYKPAAYGGGHKAKDYLKKAVDLFENQTGEITWGKTHAKEMLASLNK